MLPMITSFRNDHNLPETFYIKYNNAKGDTAPDWIYIKISFQKLIAVKIHSRLLKVQIVNLSSVYFMFNNVHVKKIKIMTQKLYEHYRDRTLNEIKQI